MARQPIAHPATPENVHEFIKSALGAPDTMRALIEAMKEVQSQEKSVDTDKAVIKAFERAGYKSVVLFDRSKTLAEQASSVTVLTYKKWSELGRVVKKGEHSIKARGYHIRLFHLDQTEPASSADKLPQVSPVPTAKPKAKGKVIPIQPSA
jgi:N-terminal domain of anti-restriction factor ArdC